MFCCGKPLTTPFCPHCGAASSEKAPLVGLLAHCHQSLEKAKTKAIGRKTELDGNVGNDWYKKRLQHADKMVAKWQSWVDALEEAIHAGTGALPPPNPRGSRI